MRILTTLSLYFLAVFTLAPSAFAGQNIGTIASVSGHVFFANASGKIIRDVKLNDSVHNDHIIETGKDGHVEITFIDGTDLSVTSEGRIKIDEFSFDANDATNNKAHLEILGATFAYIGGLVSKNDNPDVKIDIDFGSIGVRGTTLYRSMIGKECWIYLEEGAVEVSNKGGSITLNPGEGTKLSSRLRAPEKASTFTDNEIAAVKKPLAQ